MEIPWDTYQTGHNHYMNRDDHDIWGSKRCHVNQIKHFCTSIVFESILWVIRLYTLDVFSAKQPWKVRAEAWDPLDFQMIQTSNLTQTKKQKKKHIQLSPQNTPTVRRWFFFVFWCFWWRGMDSQTWFEREQGSERQIPRRLADPQSPKAAVGGGEKTGKRPG